MEKRHYKNKPLAFGSREAKLARANRETARRRQQRDQELNRVRHVESIVETEKPRETAEARAIRFQIWKAERDLQKKLEAQNKRPIFKISVPHHKFWSPTARDPKSHCHKRPKLPSPPKKISAATLRRRAARAAAGQDPAPDEKKNSTRGPENSGGAQPRISRSRKKVQDAEKKERPSIAPVNYEFKVPTGIAALPLFGEIVIPNVEQSILDFRFENKNPGPEREAPENEDVPQTDDPSLPLGACSPVPAQYSPFIVCSRGKSNARKEQQQRLSLHRNSSPAEIPMKETVMQSLNISIEEEEKTARYYKYLVDREEERLGELCETWRITQEDEEATPEDARYLINQAIGQTNLLIRKKFERFRRLVLDCETGKGEQLVRCADLQGFWDMMAMEIRDCHSRFTKLDALREKGWKEEEEEVKVVKRTVAVKKKITGKSNVRSFIEARRKKLQDPVEAERIARPVPTRRESFPKRPVSPHSTARITPMNQRTSLLKLVQLTESAKRMAQNSFAIVKVSQQCKTPEVQHDETISYVNSDQTPGKGILKKFEAVAMNQSKLNKSINKVNFNDTVQVTEVPVDEVDTKDSGETLAIDDFDFGENDELQVAKRLDFDEDDESVLHPVPEDLDNIKKEPGIQVKNEIEEITSPPLIPSILVTEASFSEDTNSPGTVDRKPARSTRRRKSRTSENPGTDPSNARLKIVLEEATPIEKPARRSKNPSPAKPEESTVRKLRNRSILLATTEKPQNPRRKSYKIRESYVKLEALETPDLDKENAGENQTSPSTPPALIDLECTQLRRTPRKSMRVLYEDECTACRPVPSTPRTRRKLSTFGNNSSEKACQPLANGDLMTFESPTPRRSRSKRYSKKS